ncbi:hypothetical protein KIM372_14330 [Bombiscardovia nodaiensis]|uniref:Uncharacterized protein n=1 Tax=Bombiscardovia nodaiensis TaxID=2932181 RepID=A0ABN6SF61_9BIFI|nr:hypothetical protein KIM372_14330 [Bombiscardovia nodaiensis]
MSASEPQESGVRPPQPLARKSEKILLMVCAALNVVMASITLFIYSPWFKDQGYEILEKAGKINQMATVNNVATVAQSYGLLLVIIGVVSFILALRAVRPGTIYKGLEAWLIFCMVFSLATADWLSLIAYSLTFVTYIARNKAIRQVQSEEIRAMRAAYEARRPRR